MRELTLLPREGMVGIFMAVGSSQSKSKTGDSQNHLSLEIKFARTETKKNIVVQMNRMERRLFCGDFFITPYLMVSESVCTLQSLSVEAQIEGCKQDESKESKS